MQIKEAYLTNSVFLKTDFFSGLLAKTYSAIRVLKNAWFPPKRLSGNRESIIKQLHALIFDPIRPYVISGDHFVDLYARDYAIFHQAALDARIGLSEEDWISRQQSMLQTVALHMHLLSLSKNAYTTYMPIGKDTYAGVNVWVRPSDALFALLLTLMGLIKEDFLQSTYPSKIKRKYQLQTIKQAQELIRQYKMCLENHIEKMLQEVIDPETQLIRKDIALSGVRDHVKRESAFYDNVVLWATVKFANELGITKVPEGNLIIWRKHIIATFWNKKKGIFLDDLSLESYEKGIFCADFLIVIAAQFLQFSRKSDTAMLERIISYVEKNKLDKPFPLWYTKKDQLEKMYLISKILFPSYVGEAMFAHWGIEYIKVLTLLGKKKRKYLLKAKKFLRQYEKQILRYGGFPEIYDTKGNIFQTLLYRSFLRSGWIVNFEQANMLVGGLINSI